MRILTTAFIALVLWIGWIIASIHFAVNDVFGSAKLSGGQNAVLAVLFLPALILTVAAAVMLIHVPFSIRKKRRLAAQVTTNQPPNRRRLCSRHESRSDLPVRVQLHLLTGSPPGQSSSVLKAARKQLVARSC